MGAHYIGQLLLQAPIRGRADNSFKCMTVHVKFTVNTLVCVTFQESTSIC